MRIISQYGAIDMSYDTTLLWVREKNGFEIVGNTPFSESVVLGEYSSKEKAYKAMKMLREQYGRLENFKVLASGTAEYMEKVLNCKEILEYSNYYRDMNVFQLPKDDEVEV